MKVYVTTVWNWFIVVPFEHKSFLKGTFCVMYILPQSGKRNIFNHEIMIPFPTTKTTSHAFCRRTLRVSRARRGVGTSSALPCLGTVTDPSRQTESQHGLLQGDLRLPPRISERARASALLWGHPTCTWPPPCAVQQGASQSRCLPVPHLGVSMACPFVTLRSNPATPINHASTKFSH